MDSLHDLTPILSKFLDPHLLLPVLEFLMHKTQFAQADLEASKLRVLAATNMVDFAMDVGLKTCSTHEFPQNMQEQRERIMSTMQLLKSEGEPILSLIADQARVAELRQERCFNQPFLQQHFNISPSHVDILHKYAKFTYDCGDYRSAADLLVHFRQLRFLHGLMATHITTLAVALTWRHPHASSPSINSDKHFSALWGKLACEILRTNWEAALEDLNSLRDSIDSRTGTPPAMQLQQRCWLMHWALFMLGNHPNGRSIIVDLFFQARAAVLIPLRSLSPLPCSCSPLINIPRTPNIRVHPTSISDTYPLAVAADLTRIPVYRRLASSLISCRIGTSTLSKRTRHTCCVIWR